MLKTHLCGTQTQSIPVSSATKRDSPIPIGAINVAFDFSAARNSTVRTSSAVKNISIKSPCAIDVPPVNLVWTDRVPGNMHKTSAAATIPPSICGGNKSAPRIGGSAPARTKPSVTLIKLRRISGRIDRDTKENRKETEEDVRLG